VPLRIFAGERLAGRLHPGGACLVFGFQCLTLGFAEPGGNLVAERHPRQAARGDVRAAEATEPAHLEDHSVLKIA
jgi:hypothetical protein